MRDERLEVSVTFDERHGYIGSAPELRQAVVALSLGGLRRKIEIAAAARRRPRRAAARRSRRARAPPPPGAGAAGALSRALGACTHTIATGDSDLIKVRFAPLC